MKLIENKKIAIIGAGPGGLTLARLLQMSGAQVKVYERDLHKDARVQGATLDLHEESGLKALEAAGLMDAFKANFQPGADKIRIMDHKADVLFDQHAEMQDDTFGSETFRPEIDRAPLRNLLIESLLPNTIVWNSHITNLSKDKNGWVLNFENGNSTLTDLVIAADGANSKIRPVLTSIKPFYSGVTIVEGTVYQSEISSPRIHKFLNGGKIFAFGDEKSIIVSSKGDGSLVFYTGCKTDENWHRDSGIDFSDRAQLHTWFQKQFSGWDSVWLELFDLVELPCTPRPQYCMPLDQSWQPQADITMLGDAAHVMPPYAGEGVNMAMLDALELSQCLQNDAFGSLQAAIESFEKHMLTRFEEIGQITLDQTAALHAPNAIAHMIDVFNGS